MATNTGIDYKSDADLQAQWDYLAKRQRDGVIQSSEQIFKDDPLKREIQSRQSMMLFGIKVGLLNALGIPL